MELNEQRYWQALRELLKRAEDEEAAELAAAERMLADTKPDPDSYFSDERIAEVVRLVTEADTDVAVANAPDDVIDGVLHSTPSRFAFARHAPVPMPVAPPAAVPAAAAAPQRAPAPVVSLASGRAKLRQRLAKLPRPLAAAAMLLLTPQFLAAASVVTVVVAVQFLQNTKDTLPFEDAVSIATDSERDYQTRLTSQQRVYLDLVESIEIIKRAATSSSSVAPAAKQALVELRRAFGQPSPFVRRTFAADLVTLGNQLDNPLADDSVRSAALADLTEQLVYGLAALASLGEDAASATLHEANRLQRQSIDSYLTH